MSKNLCTLCDHMVRVPFSWLSAEDPDHMRQVVEFATNLPCLMALTREEICGRLEGELHCQPAEMQQPGGVITAWGHLVGREDPRTGSAFHSHDAQAILLDVGPGAEYVLETIVENVLCPTREEYQRLFLLQDEEVLQHYYQDTSFRAWIDQCAARALDMLPRSAVSRIIARIRRWMGKK